MRYLLIALLFINAGCASSLELQRSVDGNSSSGNQVSDTINVCSFNIQFLGHFKNRDNQFLASMVDNYDIVVVQELVAPPIDGKYPDGTSYKADKESKAFFEEMTALDFEYWISEEDTGPTKNHTSSSASEWWIVFYRADKVMPDTLHQAYGFLDTALVGNEQFERVPYAFPFKAVNGELDFTLISVHLNPGGAGADMERRNAELTGISNWVEDQRNDEVNKDYYILGDCNIENQRELNALRDNPFFADYTSLNDSCRPTNTKYYEDPLKGKPYDHIFYGYTCKEDLILDSFKVLDFYSRLEAIGRAQEYIPYEHNSFRTSFSDHMPVSFQLVSGRDTD